jgi:hypothetical protein
MEIATAHATSTGQPAAFFARWNDVESWPLWSPDTTWAKVDGPCEVGARGVMKPAGGPKVRFVIIAAEKDREQTDVTSLLGARLRFRHLVAPTLSGGSTLDVDISMAGPMTWLWSRVLGPNFRKTAQTDLDRLVKLVESEAHVGEQADTEGGAYAGAEQSPPGT